MVGVVSFITVETSARQEIPDLSANLFSLCLTFHPRALGPLLIPVAGFQGKGRVLY
ncbi:hypothetical protein COCOBI_19-1650 [Coccomyxa sp. Obi]|nr:hypothetical protein COCOBI_19-1650 [Coccomyxa sp. Obi]